jgi:hypothetical protein
MTNVTVKVEMTVLRIAISLMTAQKTWKNFLLGRREKRARRTSYRNS